MSRRRFSESAGEGAVSYTHLDVYTRQPVGPFDIVIFYEDEADRVTVLGLVHQRAAW